MASGSGQNSGTALVAASTGGALVVTVTVEAGNESYKIQIVSSE
jgi:hypothetical protein